MGEAVCVAPDAGKPVYGSAAGLKPKTQTCRRELARDCGVSVTLMTSGITHREQAPEDS